MAETSIEWTQGAGVKGEAWNPTTGCDVVTRGCRRCYAKTMARRLKAMGQPAYQRDGDPKSSGPGFGLTLHPDRLGVPARWRKPRVVFVDSMSDLFHEQVPFEFIVEVWEAMVAAPRHTFLVLTKRARRMRDAVQRLHGMDNHGRPLIAPAPNIWLGASVENRHVVQRADELRETPAAKRFISAEPLLGPLDQLDLTHIDWLIAGGESGPGAEPMDPLWARELRDRCLDSVCPLCAGAVTVGAWRCDRCQGTGRETLFFFKQWGAWGPLLPGQKRDAEGRPMPGAFAWRNDRERAFGDLLDRHVYRTNKKHQGRVLDGRVWSERPPLAHERLDRSATAHVHAPEQPEPDLKLEARQP